MRLVFFGSSSFVIPILEDIKNGEGASLLQVLTSRREELGKIDPSYSDIVKQVESLANEENLELSDIKDKLNSPIELLGVVTQANTEHRGKIQKSGTAIWSENNNVKLFQPEKLNKQFEEWQTFVEEGFDVSVVASFGQIISQKVLDTGQWINWHPSKLPEYRGPCPMQQCLADGRVETALSWIKMTKGMDAGEIYVQVPVKTNGSDFNQLAERMGDLGKLTWPLAVLASIINNTENQSSNSILNSLKALLQPKIQNEDEVTFTKMLTKEDGVVIPNSQSAEQIYNHYLAYIQYPKTYYFSSYFNEMVRLDEVEGWVHGGTETSPTTPMALPSPLDRGTLSLELEVVNSLSSNSTSQSHPQSSEFRKIDNKTNYLLLQCAKQTFLKVISVTLSSGKKVFLKGLEL